MSLESFWGDKIGSKTLNGSVSVGMLDAGTSRPYGKNDSKTWISGKMSNSTSSQMLKY